MNLIPDDNSLKVAAGTGAAWLLGKLLSPTVKSVGEAVRDEFHSWVNRNRTSVLEAAAEQVRASGEEPHTIPNGILVPLLERCGYEDHEELRGLWASLLAKAAVSGGADVEPRFVQILANLSPLAARTLGALSVTQPLPDVYVDPTGRDGRGYTFRWLAVKVGVPADERLAAALDILVAQGLATRGSPDSSALYMDEGAAPGNRQAASILRITALGKLFLAAVTPLPGEA